MKQNIIQALCKWVLRVTEKEIASPEEVATLPEIAKIVLDYSSDCDLEVSES